MKMYEGEKPCPGCGRTGAECPRPTKDSLCYDCKKQLEIGKAIAKERNLERNNYKIDDLSVSQITWYTIRNPRIEKALCKLLNTFSMFDKERAPGETRNGGMLTGNIDSVTSRHSFVLPKITFDAARELCDAINDAAKELWQERDNYRKELEAEFAERKNEIYNDGVRHGRNLLFQLNAGQITLDELNESINKY